MAVVDVPTVTRPPAASVAAGRQALVDLATHAINSWTKAAHEFAGS